MSKKKHELLFHQEGQPARLPKELSEHLTSLLLGFNFQNNAPIIGIFLSGMFVVFASSCT